MCASEDKLGWDLTGFRVSLSACAATMRRDTGILTGAMGYGSKSKSEFNLVYGMHNDYAVNWYV